MKRALTASVLLLLAACAGSPERSSGEPANASRVREVYHAASTGRLASLCSGPASGPRLLYVHGTPGSSSNWIDYLRRPVREDWESVAVDRPGFGDSDPRGAVPSLADQAAALEGLLVERRGRRPVLVGHSLGGPIVARVAADYPERVGAIVILAGNMDPGLEKLAWYNYLSTPFEPVLPRWWRNSNRELAPQRAELVQLAARLDRVTCPVLILHGKRDDLVPFENVEYMRERFRNAERVEVLELEDAGHLLLWRQPDVVREAIGRLLDGSAEEEEPDPAGQDPEGPDSEN